MSKSIDEALQNAITELLKNPDVKSVQYMPNNSEKELKPCELMAKVLSVFHKVNDSDDSYTFSTKVVYINTKTFEYYWNYGGPKVKKIIENNISPVEP